MTPFVLVIFGATGDLARSKLFPSLYNLYQNDNFSDKFYIVGFARRSYTDESFREFLTEYVDVEDELKKNKWKAFLKNVFYQQGVFEEKDGYKALIKKLNAYDREIGACITRLFYLATPPDNYESILEMLAKTKLSEGCGQGSNKWTHIIVEKPFGKDLDSAKMLDQKLAETFEEKQIFRVDHYLGKETVQNVIAFRFANSIFEPVWNRDYIDHIQITWGERKGVGGRGRFFDGVGLLRDVAQNHLMQLVAAATMEQPKTFSKEGVRDARADAIKKIQDINPKEVDTRVVRGQYKGYLNEKDVSSKSQTESFVAMKIFTGQERFKGVPIYIRAAKKAPEDIVEISIVFIQTCHILFKEYGCPEVGNVLTIRIQPDESIVLRVVAKQPHFAEASRGGPGEKLALGTVEMKFSYADAFGGKGMDAYEKLLLDIFHDDQMLFNRSDELESSWGFISNIRKGWNRRSRELFKYESGTWGPKEAQELIEKDGRKWL